MCAHETTNKYKIVVFTQFVYPKTEKMLKNREFKKRKIHKLKFLASMFSS